MTFEFDSEKRTLTVNGVPIAFEVLEGLTQPKSNVLYRVRNIDGAVIIDEIPEKLVMLPVGNA